MRTALGDMAVVALGGARCTDCPLVEPSDRVDGLPRCTVRGHGISDPTVSVCANHLAFGPERLRLPVGPVFRESAGGRRIAHVSPDSSAIRRALVEMIADWHPRAAGGLGLREATAAWQLEQFAERRAFVHLDRIGAPQTRSRPWLDLERSLLGDALYEQAGAPAEGREVPFLERFTLAGRLLLLLSLLAAVGSAVLSLDGVLRGGGWTAWAGILVSSAVGAGSVLAAGAAVLNWVGIPILAGDDPRRE